MPAHFPTFRRLAGGRFELPFARLWYTTAGRRRALLRLIAVAIEEKLPLGPLVAAWAEDERGPQKTRLRRLVRLLDSGTPLPDAVEAVPGVLSDEQALAIRFDSQSGTRTTAVRQLLEESQPAARPRRLLNTIIYFCLLLVLGFPAMLFMQVKITPVLSHILDEFDLEQPWALDWSQRFGNVVAQYWWLGALAALVVLLAVFTARPGRLIRSRLARFFGPVRELRAADVLQKIGIAAVAGRPVPGALSTLARYHFDPAIRHKLLFVRNEVEQGADVWQSLSAVDLLTPVEVRVLATSERVGNRPWALTQLARGKTRRTLRRLDRWSELLLPIVVIVLGAFVLLHGLSLFLLLTQIVHGLA